MQTNLIEAPSLEQETRSAMSLQQYAEAFTITSSGDSAKAQETRAQVNTKIKELTDQRLGITRKIDAAKKAIMDLFAGPIGLLEAAKGVIDQKVLAYDAEQERQRREAQRKAEAEAAKERARLQAIADEALRKANAEAAEKRRLAEAAAAAGRAEEAAKLRAQAAKVEDKAAVKVDQFESRAASVVAPIIQADTVKVAGTSFRDNWKHRITDPKKINPTFMMTVPNEALIAATVKSMKLEAASLIGEGIEIFNDRGLASKRA